MTACLRFAIANPNDFGTSQTRETLAEILLEKKPFIYCIVLLVQLLQQLPIFLQELQME